MFGVRIVLSPQFRPSFSDFQWPKKACSIFRNIAERGVLALFRLQGIRIEKGAGGTESTVIYSASVFSGADNPRFRRGPELYAIWVICSRENVGAN